LGREVKTACGEVVVGFEASAGVLVAVVDGSRGEEVVAMLPAVVNNAQSIVPVCISLAQRSCWTVLLLCQNGVQTVVKVWEKLAQSDETVVKSGGQKVNGYTHSL
jgi:hypothetical protein